MKRLLCYLGLHWRKREASDLWTDVVWVRCAWCGRKLDAEFK